MEFPEDILPLIREYARPRMKYIQEYNQIVRLLGVEWPEVKKKLETKDAEIVLDQFAYYAEAVVLSCNSKDAVPILPEEHSYSDYMMWLVATRNYSAYVEVRELRKLSLLKLLK
jgi:hypothetical protein